MKVYLQSYNNFAQNIAGGVKTKVFNYKESLSRFPEIECSFFNKWTDKIADSDIIHYFALKPEFYEQILFAKGLGKKVVVSSIVPMVHLNWIRFNRFLGVHLRLHTVYHLNQCILDNADAIISETKKEKDFILKAYKCDPKKIFVIPNGVATDVQGGDPSLVKKKFGLKKDCIVHVSRIDRNKNQLSVIRAMKDTGIPIVFIGGPDSNDMAYYEQCKAEATANMFFAGWVYHDDPLLASTLAAAKVSVLPSYNETFGNSIYESLLAGCNVVATNTLSMVDWGLENDVISCDPSSLDSIRESIITAYYKEIDTSVIQRVKRDFSFESIAKKHIEIYQSLL